MSQVSEQIHHESNLPDTRNRVAIAVAKAWSNWIMPVRNRYIERHLLGGRPLNGRFRWIW